MRYSMLIDQSSIHVLACQYCCMITTSLPLLPLDTFRNLPVNIVTIALITNNTQNITHPRSLQRSKKPKWYAMLVQINIASAVHTEPCHATIGTLAAVFYVSQDSQISFASNWRVLPSKSCVSHEKNFLWPLSIKVDTLGFFAKKCILFAAFAVDIS